MYHRDFIRHTDGLLARPRASHCADSEAALGERTSRNIFRPGSCRRRNATLYAGGPGHRQRHHRHFGIAPHRQDGPFSLTGPTPWARTAGLATSCASSPEVVECANASGTRLAAAQHLQRARAEPAQGRPRHRIMAINLVVACRAPTRFARRWSSSTCQVDRQHADIRRTLPASGCAAPCHHPSAASASARVPPFCGEGRRTDHLASVLFAPEVCSRHLQHIASP